MTRQPVKSTNIKSVGYDPATQTLEVEFHSGSTHQYTGVPPDKHARMMQSRSIGKFFHGAIRKVHRSKQV